MVTHVETGEGRVSSTAILITKTKTRTKIIAIRLLGGIMGHGVKADREDKWIHDIEEWTGCEYIQLKEMSQDRAQWRR